MTNPDFEAAKAYALQRLANELPPTAHYHCLQHTRDDVVVAAERFAVGEGIDGDERLCLLTAAYFHDLGHIEQSKNHEEISARIASEVLPRFGYSARQIDIIRRLIMATKVPQTPVTLLEEIIVDADMDSLGRDDFMKTSLALRRELAATGNHASDLAWYEGQVEFLSAHRYFTGTAQKLRDPGKQRNLTMLHDLIAELTSHQE